MPKQKSKTSFYSISVRPALVLIAIVMAVSAVVVPKVNADQFQEKINQLNQDNAQKQQTQDQLGAQAASLSDTISKLQSQIDALEAQIQTYQAQIDSLRAQITEQEAELARQKRIMGESIKAMYLEGQISTLEMLASSKDLSDFVDKEQYRNTVQAKIKDTLDKITELKRQLKAQKEEAEQILSDKQSAQSELDTQRGTNAQLLALTQDQQAQLNQQIKQNFTKIAELRRQQAIENAKLSGGVPGVGATCGGTYPGTVSGPAGTWGCYRDLDNTLDNWGMYNRECVSYTAWRVHASGRNMPGWGWQGIGNANQWDDNARNSGIPVDNSPRDGDVAVSNLGSYGHVMYVEATGSDGSIFVSDYNQQYDGMYREYWISASNVQGKGLVFIHFP